MHEAATASYGINTLVLGFSRRDGEGSATLVGAVRVAQPDYYAELRALLAQLTGRGATVYYQDAGRPTAQQVAVVAPWMRASAARFAQICQMDTDALLLPGLVRQQDALPADPAWQCPDLSVEQVVRYLGAAQIDRQHEQIQQSRQHVAQMLPAVRRLVVLQSLALGERIARGLADRGQVLPGVHQALAARREAAVLRALDQARAAAPDGAFALVWDPLYLHGLEAGLERRGYVLTTQEELCAIRVDALPGWKRSTGYPRRGRER